MQDTASACGNYYVSLQGRDTWTGSLADPDGNGTDGPFRTLERAAEAVRAAEHRGSGATVTVRAGVYALGQTFTLTADDSGTEAAPTVYQAYPGETVIFAGGVQIPPEAFQPVRDAHVIERLDPVARDQVMQADLGALGITDLGEFPVNYQGSPAVPELFFNDRRMTLARWPNEGWTTVARIVAPGSWLAPPNCETRDEGGVFEYDSDRPARWNAATGVWLHGYWTFDWYDEVIQIQSIDRDTRQITLAAPAKFGVKPRNPSPRRWRALNLLEELDCPGEYYIDRSAGLLYFWPPAPLHGARIILSTLRGPVVAICDAQHVTLRGFTVEATIANGIDVTGGSDVRIEACEVRNTRELGISVTGGTAHRVTGCEVHDTGAGGIRITGGDRKTLTPAGHVAINNHIHHFSYHRQTSAYGLWLSGVGNRAAHNLIHDAPHQAVAIGGNDHVFELNIVHHVCLETDDCGALYKGRNPSCRGNVIRFNYWHDIGSPRGHGNGAIYFDDGDGGDLVFGNVFLRCCEPGKARWGAVYSHGGHDIRAENNIFIECKRALGSGPWNDEKWQKALTGANGHEWPKLLLQDVDITQPPYTTRYPQLVGFMDATPGRPRNSRAVRNLIVNCGDVSSGNWIVPSEENWITTDDPGFVDAANGDFRLKPDAIVFTRVPGFEMIPFEKMGLKSSEVPTMSTNPKGLQPLAGG